MPNRVLRVAALAAALVLGLLPALDPSPVAAATPKLTLVGAATYDVRPDDGRVAVTVRLTATNHLQNTATKRFYYRTAFLTVLPGTSGFKLTAKSGTPKVTVATACSSRPSAPAATPGSRPIHGP